MGADVGGLGAGPQRPPGLEEKSCVGGLGGAAFDRVAVQSVLHSRSQLQSEG